MDARKQQLISLGKMGLSLGLTIFTQGQSALFMPILNSISSGLLGGSIQNLEYSKIKNLIRKPHPSELNHDLRKVVIESIEYAITNIQFLYTEKLKMASSNRSTLKSQKSELEKAINGLLSGIKNLEALSDNGSDKPLFEQIEKPQEIDAIQSEFIKIANDLPVVNPNIPFNKFFEEQFISNLQLCFGELLKSEKKKPAYIAYQREVYSALNNSIEKVIQQNTELLKKLDIPEKAKVLQRANSDWTEVKQRITDKEKDKITPEFEKAFNDYFAEISGKMDLLVDLSKDIQKDLGLLHYIISNDWVSKNMVFVATVIGVLFLIIIGLITYNLNAPFNAVVNVYTDSQIKVHSEYPKLSDKAKIRFYFPSGINEKEVTFSNEIVLNDLSKKYEGDKIYAELLDSYWTLSSDSVEIGKGNIIMLIKPNEVLSKIEGRVLSRDGQILLNNVSVRSDSLKTNTDKDGKFTIDVPISLRRMQYVLRVEKPGYEVAELEYYAGSEKEIRLIAN